MASKTANRIPTSQLSTTAKAARLFVQHKDGSVKPIGLKSSNSSKLLLKTVQAEKKEPMICYEYNELKCPRKSCHYLHKCSMCDGGHTAKEHRAKENQKRLQRDSSEKRRGSENNE